MDQKKHNLILILTVNCFAAVICPGFMCRLFSRFTACNISIVCELLNQYTNLNGGIEPTTRLVCLSGFIMNEIVKADLFRHDGFKGTKGFIRGWFRPGFRYTYILRMTMQHGKYSLRGIFFRLLKYRYRHKYHFEISSEASIGEGFFLTPHIGPVVIGPVKIGKNCNISHSVTIGRAYRKGRAGRPTIGDYVWIGAGSVLVGEISIGSNVLIAPNSFVNFDVPGNSLVIGNPGKIISRENATAQYIHNVLNK